MKDLDMLGAEYVTVGVVAGRPKEESSSWWKWLVGLGVVAVGIRYGGAQWIGGILKGHAGRSAPRKAWSLTVVSPAGKPFNPYNVKELLALPRASLPSVRREAKVLANRMQAMIESPEEEEEED